MHPRLREGYNFYVLEVGTYPGKLQKCCEDCTRGLYTFWIVKVYLACLLMSLNWAPILGKILSNFMTLFSLQL